jgi:putative MATE family efflux protein
MKQQGNFTQGPILAPLCRFALPVLLALLLQAAYGAADLLIVGQFSDAANISAVSTGSQIMHTFTTVAAGFAMGVTVLIGKKIGEGSPDEAGRVIGGGAALFVWMGIAATLLVPFFAGPLCRLMQAPEAAFAQTQSYVRICALGSLFILSYNVLGSVFRGVGDSKTPLFTVAAASLFNVAGDLLLVAGLKLGAAGAAIATVAAQGLSVFICLLVVRKKTLPFAFSKEYLRLDQKISGAIFRLGAPVALQSLLVNISFLAILAIVNSMGVLYSAGVGVAEKLCGFIMLAPDAYMQALSVFVAQNIGAGNLPRANKALACGVGVSLFTSLFLAYALDTLLVSFLFSFIGYYNGRGKTLFVMCQGLAGAFFVRIPVSYLMSRLPNATLFRIGLATPASSVVQIFLCAVYFAALSRRPAPADESKS